MSKMGPKEIEEVHQLLQTRAEYVESHRIASQAGEKALRLYVGVSSIDFPIPKEAVPQSKVEEGVQIALRQHMIDCTCENLELAIDSIDARLRDLGLNIEPFFGHEVDGELINDFSCDDG